MSLSPATPASAKKVNSARTRRSPVSRLGSWRMGVNLGQAPRVCENPAVKPLVSIQYLRALAALAVAVYHASQWRPGHLIDLGRAGVDVFFVISGVIMWKVTGAAEHAPGVF